jgi:hypothetical protein
VTLSPQAELSKKKYNEIIKNYELKFSLWLDVYKIAGLDLNLVSNIKKAIDDNGHFEIRNSSKASTTAIFNALGW